MNASSFLYEAFYLMEVGTSPTDGTVSHRSGSLRKPLLLSCVHLEPSKMSAKSDLRALNQRHTMWCPWDRIIQGQSQCFVRLRLGSAGHRPTRWEGGLGALKAPSPQI